MFWLCWWQRLSSSQQKYKESHEFSSGFLCFYANEFFIPNVEYVIENCFDEYYHLRYSGCFDQPLFNLIVDKFNWTAIELGSLGFFESCYYKNISKIHFENNKIFSNGSELAFVHFAGVSPDKDLRDLSPESNLIFEKLNIKNTIS